MIDRLIRGQVQRTPEPAEKEEVLNVETKRQEAG